MVHVRSFLVTLILALTLISGCIGGEDDEVDPGEGGEQNNVKDGATVRGQVFDVNLNPINRARVTLVTTGMEVAAEGSSSEDGSYSIGGIEPGRYRLTVSAACCEEEITTLDIGPNDELEQSFMLTPYSDEDLKIPHGVYDERAAFIACQFTVPGISYSSGCGVVEGNAPRAGVDGGKGLRTFVAALVWEGGAGAAAAQELQFQIRNKNNDIYALESGTSPIVVRLDNSEIPEDLPTFDEYDEDGLLLELSATPTDGSFVYQQEIRYYWYKHYWEEAPGDINVLPDG